MTLLALVLAYLVFAPPLCRWLEKKGNAFKGVDSWE